MAQQQRFALAALAHILKTLLAAPPHRKHVVVPDKNGDLAHVLGVVTGLGQVEHDEHHLAILFNFGPLMAFAGVFNGEFMQTELLLHLLEFFVRRVQQRYPDEGVGLVQPVADVVHTDVSALATVFVDNAVDEHGNGVRKIQARAASISPASLDGVSCGA